MYFYFFLLCKRFPSQEDSTHVLLLSIKKVILCISLFFNDQGRLKQVEYAMEAINKAGSAIGVLTPFGIILATEKQSVSALLEQSTSLIIPLMSYLQN